MSVTCRREDKAAFEALGFVLEFDPRPESLIIEMIDEQANYAHHDQMPTHLPYTAAYGAGSNYGPGSIACDGKQYAEIAASEEGFMVAWDFKKSQPTRKSVQQIRQFIRIEKRAGNILNKLREQDRVENQPCPRQTTN